MVGGQDQDSLEILHHTRECRYQGVPVQIFQTALLEENICFIEEDYAVLGLAQV